MDENGAPGDGSDSSLIQDLHSALNDFEPQTPTVSDPGAGGDSSVSSSGPASGNAPTVPVPGPNVPSANITNSSSAINSGITEAESTPATATGGSNIGQGGGSIPPTSNDACDPGSSQGPIKFGQKSVSRFFTSAEDGSTWTHAGESIASVASGLRDGSISPDELGIEYVVRDGEMIAINNRSLLALRRAGFEPTQIVDVTGDAFAEKRITQRLAEMGGSGSDTIRVRGAGSDASYLDGLSSC